VKRLEHPKVPPYVADVLRLTEQLKLGTIAHVEIRHERDCALLNGVGGCDCRPEVSLVTPQ
jgi:hypothetical protein